MTIVRRQINGEETRYRLLNWVRGQTPSERLSSHILCIEGFKSIDPSHPLGGVDGKKDLICFKDGLVWIGASFFPNGQKTFGKIKRKFLEDIKGVYKDNSIDGFIFITNQKITLAERAKLKKLTSKIVQIYHLDRVTNILNSPLGFGARQDYLDINMTIEEKISAEAFIKKVDQEIVENKIEKLEEEVTDLKKLMFRLVNPKPKELIADLLKINQNEYLVDHSVGTAGFLLEALHFYQKGKENSHDPFRINIKLDQVNQNFKNRTSGDSNIEVKDSLKEIIFKKQYDVILTNPPIYHKEVQNEHHLENHSNTNIQLKFLRNVYLSLRPNGKARAAIILNDNALNDPDGKSIRHDFMEKCKLHTILRLPIGESQEKMNVLFFTREKTEIGGTKEVWIYDMRTSSTSNSFGKFEDAYSAYDRRDVKDIRWHLITREEISLNGDSLDIHFKY